ncbi:hypothetical protein AAHA92_13415 [Salvia divinorum]|uniref:Uncharacterized protein n=1 Tax=Salvia divinorum TaxID=28513 RepID=A0ABD1H917_SALDI
MWKSDVRFVILVAINVLKSHMAMPWEWDPFEVTNDLTWIKFLLLTTLFFFFAFIAIEIISLTSPNNIGFVKVQINSFSPTFSTCFLACLLLPQFLFWYVYPMILLSFWWYACVSSTFVSFLTWVGARVSEMPDLNIVIAAANAGPDDELHGVEEG